MVAPFRVFFRDEDWKDRVHIQRVTHTADDAGGNLTIVQTVKRNLACVVASQGMTETSSLQRLGAEETHTITFRVNPCVRNGDRFLFRGRLLMVRTVKNEYNLNIIWTVTCLEQIA